MSSDVPTGRRMKALEGFKAALLLRLRAAALTGGWGSRRGAAGGPGRRGGGRRRRDRHLLAVAQPVRPSTTTRSPAFSPSVTCVMPPSAGPSLIGRIETVSSAPIR